MNTKKLSKQETHKEVKRIFSAKPSPKQIKKAKRLAMSKNIKLGILKRKFCKKCLTFFTPNNSKIRFKKPHKIIKCKNCNHLSRFKLL